MSNEFNTGDPKLDAMLAKDEALIKEEEKKEARENQDDHDFKMLKGIQEGRIPMDPGLLDQGKSEFAKTVESELAGSPEDLLSQENIDGEPKPGTPAHKEWVKLMNEGDID